MALKKKCCEVVVGGGVFWKMMEKEPAIEEYRNLKLFEIVWGFVCINPSRKIAAFWPACANSSSLASRSFEISSCKRRLAAGQRVPVGLPSWLDPASKRVQGGPVSLQRLETWQSWIHEDGLVIFDA